ncbi:outer membrane beta-barrel protein [Psychroserpens luteus]|uniref:Outer membrane beta-barrel protein n=1 Tax=Psychroserpens luteus TaxID=1434066 RepID=A0ABW5ZR75_9FLAO|nr:outer membrane beta-barrel protein [Psychroserpens luteus]
MKKLLFIAAVAVFGLSNVNAQDEAPAFGFAEGDIFATGSIAFGSESEGDLKTNSFNFSPKAGYFVSENIAVGVALGVTTSKLEEPGFEDLKGNMFEAGVFGRYYFTPAKQFSIFGELGANYETSKLEQGPNELKNDGFNIGLAPGISYFVSDCFALEASFGVLNYATNEDDIDGAESTDTFSFGLDLTDINFGIVYKF